MNIGKGVNENTQTKKEKLLHFIKHNKSVLDLVIQFGMLTVTILSMILSVCSSLLTYYIWDKNDSSSTEQHNAKMSLESRYTLQDYILKSKLNEIEVKQEAAMQTIGSMLDKSAAITERIAESNKHQVDIANRMIEQTEANVELHGKAMSLPKSHFEELEHNEYAPDSTVIMLMLTINNRSSEPIDILESACKISEDIFAARSLCAAVSVKDADGHIIKLNTLEELYDDLNNNESRALNEFMKYSAGDYYANLREYPMSFHMAPYEEKIGFLFFHIDNVYSPDEFPIKVGIRTNRGVFRENFIVCPLKLANG